MLFPYIIGVSAGGRERAFVYIGPRRCARARSSSINVGNPEYVSRRNLLRKGSMFGFDYIFQTIPEQHIRFDWDAYNAQETRFLTGAMNSRDGKTVWFEKDEITPPFSATVASCSVPILTKVQHFKGYDLLDGGTSDPIPIEKSIADGNRFHVVVLTAQRRLQKGAVRARGLFEGRVPQVSAVAEAMLCRHEIYNRQLALCEQLEKEGKAAIIRPLEPLRVGRTSADVPTLLALHDEGLREGRAALPRILEALQKSVI